MESEIPEGVEGEVNVKRLILLMTKINAQFSEGKTDILLYTDMYIEWTKYFKQHFGNTLYVAFKGKCQSTPDKRQTSPTKQTRSRATASSSSTTGTLTPSRTTSSSSRSS